jgi:hypothetical protein
MSILTGLQTHTLPPRKAAPLAQSPSAEDVGNRPRSPSKSAELHSPLSPLSPGSPIFPDGIFTPSWLAKHQHQIPAAFIAFFDMRAGDGAAADDQIKSDINSVRSALSRSGFKTRFAAILLSDKSILHAAELEDRLASIRRSTNLDSKTGLYFMPPVSSQSEMGAFVQGVLTTLQPSVVEYYRDLTKHARRKKARGSIPTTVSVPSSQSLSNVGWNARYEAKQGIFAEFRQEMDVAERHYSQAIEDLFNPEGVFETTPSWHPRWNEARLLSDVLAMRVLRCQLWNSSTTGAAQSWSNYRLRMKDLVDRRGKGSQTYGWEAWESRWAKIMAELTRRADLPALRTQAKQPLDGSNKVEPTSLLPYALPEKAFAAIERLPPFDLLHHAGYWLRLALSGTRARWQRSLAIPEEDRSSPDGSPASAVAKRARAYDTYLVPPPHKESPLSGGEGFDHLAAIQQLSDLSCREFMGKGQMRLGEKIRLNAGNDLIEAGRFEDALEQLTPLWEKCTWRNDGWYSLYEELLSQLHKCAVKVQKDPRLILATTWELLGADHTIEGSKALDIRHCVDGLELEAVSVQCKDRQRLSPISLSFAFANRQAFAGEPLNCQLKLTSNVRTGAEPLALSIVRVAIDGTRPVVITHKDGAPVRRATNISLNTTDEKLSGDANLALQPQETRVFNFALTFREAQAVKVQEATLSLVTEQFSIHHSFHDDMLLQTPVWLSELDDQLAPSSLYRDETTVVDVLPKPPKIQVLLHGLHQQYYIGEQVDLQLEIVNGEADAVQGTIRQVVVAQDDIVLHSHFGTHGEPSGDEQDPTSEAGARQDFSGLQPSDIKKIGLSVDAPMEPLLHTLTIDVDYTSASEPDTPLKKSVVVELLYVAPFEAKFNFGPLVHTHPWPSYFDPALLSPSGEPPSGIPQRWRLGSQVTSIASESITVQSAEMVNDQVNDDADIKVVESSEDEMHTVAPNAKFDRSFQISTQKLSLDDRRPTFLELSLAITWKRTADSPLCTTRVPAPRLNIPSSEPRVLCIASPSDDDQTDMVLKYYLENSSIHHLTFAVTMEANDDFAFQGPKHTTFSLVPFSRHELTYNLLLNGNREETGPPSEPGRWVWPVLKVVDLYFQKTLRVLAAGPGVRVDPQRGIGVWVPAVKA